MTRAVRLFAVLVVVLPVFTALPGTSGAAEVTRARGDDRVETAILLSQAAFPTAGSTDAVVVAASGNFPDALAAAPLAAAAGAPVLLNPNGGLDQRVEDEIRRLVADVQQATAYLMGGPAAQSSQVESDLEAVVGTVTRIEDPEHPDRFGTAAQAARTAVQLWGGDAGSHVLVALGAHPVEHRAWPDALASGALAGHARWPILLVAPHAVPAVTNGTLEALGAERATVVGGPAAIPQSTADDLAVPHDRIGGDDRYHTSTLLADAAVARGGSLTPVIAATGQNFPDGLAAGPAAFATGGVTALVATEDLVASQATKTWFEENAADVGSVLVAGGPDAVSPETAGQIGFATEDIRLTIEEVGSGFSSPVYVTSAPGDERLFVVEQGGRIRFLGGGTFLDISGRVSAGGERGLLGLAFHPGYADNGRFFVHYTDVNGDTVVEEYRRATADSADGQAVRRLLFLDQPYSNHNGGQLELGPDGFLYLGLGDGGSGGDPEDRAQDTSNLFGAIARIDPDGTGITNHMHGLRNPYRFSIDATDGLIYIGDVGQNDWEEVDVVPYSRAGTNFGWNEMEGNHCYPEGSSCDPGLYTLPVLEYPLPSQGGDGTCAVTGGVVYRGSAIPEMRGQYLYADYCAGWVRGFHYHDGIRSDEREWFDTGGNPAGFGFGPDGEVYLADRGGRILKVVQATP